MNPQFIIPDRFILITRVPGTTLLFGTTHGGDIMILFMGWDRDSVSISDGAGDGITMITRIGDLAGGGVRQAGDMIVTTQIIAMCTGPCISSVTAVKPISMPRRLTPRGGTPILGSIPFVTNIHGK